MPVGPVTTSKPRVSASPQQSAPGLPAGIDSGMLSKLGISTSILRTPDQSGITGTQTTSNHHEVPVDNPVNPNNPNDTPDQSGITGTQTTSSRHWTDPNDPYNSNSQNSFYPAPRDPKYDFIFGFLHWLLHLLNPNWQGSSHDQFHRLFDPAWQQPCPWPPLCGPHILGQSGQESGQQPWDPWSQWNEQAPTSDTSTQGSTASMTNQGSTVAKATTQGLQVVNPQSLKSK